MSAIMPPRLKDCGRMSGFIMWLDRISTYFRSGVKKRALSWWHTVRKSRANLALLVVGTLLILMSPVWHLVVAPALRVVANDFDSIYFFDGSLTTYLSVPGQAPAVVPIVVPVVLEQTQRGRPDLSNSEVSAVQVNNRLLSSDGRTVINKTQRVFTIDRRSGEVVSAPGQDRKRTGYYLVFPFDVPPRPLPYWVEQIGAAIPARFAGREKVEALPCYQFEAEYHNRHVPTPEGYPEAMSGAQLKSFLGMPGLPIGDAVPVDLRFVAPGREIVLVEPEAGTPVDYPSSEQSVSVAAGGGSAGFAVTRLLFKFDYSMRRSSVSEAVLVARDEMAKLRLQFLYIPLGFLALGAVSVLAGGVAGIRFLRNADGAGGGGEGPRQGSDDPDQMRSV